jgi:predicted small lipoprotein YifL
MRNVMVAGLALAVVFSSIVGCGPSVPPLPPVKPLPPVDPDLERKKEAARYQERIVMDEVARTHPVLTATLRKDMDKLREELRKAPNRINEVRRDMRLGPPLREACRHRWEPGITELMSRGAKCLGDGPCESCVRSRSGGSGNWSTPGGTGGTGDTGGSGSSTPPRPAMPPPPSSRSGDAYPSRTTGGYLGETPTRYPKPAP